MSPRSGKDSHPAFDLARWERVGFQEAADELKDAIREGRAGRRGPARASRWVNDGSVSPLGLYCYLKARFGDPNGALTWFRGPGTDSPFQWDYALRCGQHTIHAIGGNACLEVVVRGHEPPKDEQWRTLVRVLKADMRRMAAEMRAVRSALERWSVFVNPYYRLDRVAARLEQELGGIDLNRPSAALADRQAWSDRILEALLLGTCIRMVAPVLAESFVNTLTFVLGRPEIRADPRLYEATIRQSIDVRVKSLSLHCIGFARPVGGDAKEFKDFHTLMNRRNEFLHGNVDPTKLQFAEVFFDKGTIPVFADEEALGTRLLLGLLHGVEPDAALDDLRIVRGFVPFILGHLDAPIRAQVEIMLATSTLGWEKDDARLGILFPETIVSAGPANAPAPP